MHSQNYNSFDLILRRLGGAARKCRVGFGVVIKSDLSRVRSAKTKFSRPPSLYFIWPGSLDGLMSRTNRKVAACSILIIFVILTSAQAQSTGDQNPKPLQTQRPPDSPDGSDKNPFYINLRSGSSGVRPPISKDTSNAKRSLDLCDIYSESAAWEKAISYCENSVLLGNPDANGRLFTALNQLWGVRRDFVMAQLSNAESEIKAHHLAHAESELSELKARIAAQQFRLDPTTDTRVRKITNDIATAKREWMPAWLGVVVSYSLEVFSAAFIVGLLIFGLAPLVRRLCQEILMLFQRAIGLSVWRVLTVIDKTDQNAIGAVMDGLNPRFNPLFAPILTSSFLAIPPGLVAQNGNSPRTLGVFRNFLTEDLVDVRPPLSFVLEFINEFTLRRLRFIQLEAFEDDAAVKIGGYFEASVGRLIRSFQRWAITGLPALTGVITHETIDQAEYTQVRLVANWRRESMWKTALRSSGGLTLVVEPSELFSSGETISASASTALQPQVDALSLAAQRAAFRMIYRIAINFEQPNLGIAASCYRQGLRLLNFSL